MFPCVQRKQPIPSDRIYFACHAVAAVHFGQAREDKVCELESPCLLSCTGGHMQSTDIRKHRQIRYMQT